MSFLSCRRTGTLVFLARDFVDALNRIGWKAKRDTSMNEVPDGLSVWPEDDVARAICNALTMATGALVTLRKDQHLKDQGVYAIGTVQAGLRFIDAGLAPPPVAQGDIRTIRQVSVPRREYVM